MEAKIYFSDSSFLLVQVVNLSIFQQALNKISKFVRSNILPGAVAEVGLLCCACVHSNPEEAVVHLVEPLLLSVISSLRGTPVTGYGGRGTSDAIITNKVCSTAFVACLLCLNSLLIPFCDN